MSTTDAAPSAKKKRQGLTIAAVAGVGLMLMLSSAAKGSTPKPAPKPAPKPKPKPGPEPEPVPNEAILMRIAQALATGSPAAMHAEAAKLRREGYKRQADDLDRAAVIAQAALDGLPDPPPPIPAPIPLPPGPGPRPAPGPTPLGPRLLKRGTSGADVLAWQMQLEKDKISVDKDSQFGPATEAATKWWQLDHGLKPDGIVGPKTLEAIGGKTQLGARQLKKGDQGPAVAAWQTVLGRDGYAVASIGKFDDATEWETKEWQTAHGLKGDGIVGPKTVAKIGTPPIAISSAPAQKPAPAVVKPTAAPKGPVPLVLTSIPPLKSVDPDKWRLMRRGTAGADVSEWQMVLNRDGYATAMDGKFGPATEAATKAWQTKHGLKSDGVVGPATRAAISERPEQSATIAGDWDTTPAPQRWMSAPAHLRGTSPLPGILPAQIPDEIVPEDRAMAARVSLHLFEHKRGTEDRAIVAEFQKANGVNPTGAYGPATALAFVSYGIVPPKPFYWPSKGSTHAKTGYRLTLMREARNDAQRADEWASAANV